MARSFSERNGVPDQVPGMLAQAVAGQAAGLYLHVDQSTPRLADLVARVAAGSPLLARLRGFGISCSTSSKGLTDEGARLLAASPHLAGLHRLNLCDNEI